ncbi:MAG: UPF0182 family protein [Acidimicrobiia bacterium]|nr:UPF0182 family protein [Acidimicrobiia bacterium]
MRRSSDLPRRRRVSGRAFLITFGVLFLVVAVFGRAIARIYIEYLWYSSLERGDVFWTRLGAQATMFGLFAAVFLVLAFVNLVIADRLAPKAFPANVHPYVERFHDLFGRRLSLVRYAVALAVGIVLAAPATSQWQNWLLFRNAQSFGLSDPQFNVDVGFYVFRLPFITFALDWIFVATVVVLLLTVATHVLNGGVVFTSPLPTIRAATKAHLAVLLALLAALKAADYWVTRYDKTNERRGFVQGATYTVVNAELPALMLLLLIAVLTAGLFLYSVRTGSWRLPIIVSAMWLVVALIGGVIYPAVVQRLVVRPDQQSRELQYLDRNIDATTAAFGISPQEVEVANTQQFGALTAGEIEDDLTPLRDARLLNPTELLTRFRVDQGQDAGLIINDLDVDRAQVDDEDRQVLVAARELDLASIANRSWQGQHLISTRGCGLVQASSSQVVANDRPDYRRVELERPELYFSPRLDGWAITNTDQVERGCEDEVRTSGAAVGEYTGDTGVKMSSFARRAAFALAFLDYNVVGSQAINDDSQMLWVRDVRERARKLAPFLSFDGDPYPVAYDGRVVWINDAYTSTSAYPYSQRVGNAQLGNESGISPSDNYVRNSVKVVVDGYDGSVTFYVVDPDDPIIQAWQSAFPDLLTNDLEVPDELRQHFRYPEDLFRVQTELYSKYRLGAADFFDREDAWSVAQAPSVTPRGGGTTPTDVVTETETGAEDATAAGSDFATESGSARFTPYYTYYENESGEQEFVLMRPFVPFSSDDQRTELQSYMTASNDPDRYGDLTVYPVERSDGGLPDGPLAVAGRIESEDAISQQITLLNGAAGGSQVRYGDLQIVPVGDGLLWVRPLYVSTTLASQQVRSVSEFRYVLVSHNGRSAFGESLESALAVLFPGFDAEIGDRIAEPSDPEANPDPGTGVPDPTDPPEPTVPTSTDPSDTGPTSPTSPTTETPSTVDPDASPEVLLEQADDLLAQAEEVLREEGDLGEYQRLVQQAGALIEAARERLGTSTTSPTATTTISTGTTTSSADSTVPTGG